jgi:hypothetical protein
MDNNVGSVGCCVNGAAMAILATDCLGVKQGWEGGEDSLEFVWP